jgi:hypothetical protein
VHPQLVIASGSTPTADWRGSRTPPLPHTTNRALAPEDESGGHRHFAPSVTLKAPIAISQSHDVRHRYRCRGNEVDLRDWTCNVRTGNYSSGPFRHL